MSFWKLTKYVCFQSKYNHSITSIFPRPWLKKSSKMFGTEKREEKIKTNQSYLLMIKKSTSTLSKPETWGQMNSYVLYEIFFFFFVINGCHWKCYHFTKSNWMNTLYKFYSLHLIPNFKVIGNNFQIQHSISKLI